LNKILEETKQNEINELRNVLNSVNESEQNVNTVYKKYLHQTGTVKLLKGKVEILKVTLKKHFDQMENDSEYLKQLDLIRPKYFKTLERYNKQLSIVKSTVQKSIMDGDDKRKMLKIIDDANEHTQNITGQLSKAFLEHYEKYKNLLNKDSAAYESEMKELTRETAELTIKEKINHKYYEEYSEAMILLTKLKKTYAESKSEAEDFDNIARIIKTLFNDPQKIQSFIDGPVDGKCANTILRTHIKNNLI